MATTLSVITSGRFGTTNAFTLAAADAAGNNWLTSGNEMLIVFNGSGSPITVTYVFYASSTSVLVDGQVPSNPTESVAAGAYKILGPFPSTFYKDSFNRMNVTWSSVISVTCAVIAKGN